MTDAALAWAAYRFEHNVYTGTVWLDDYQEFSLWQTNYSYTARDDLVKVVDALGNTTLITYDGFGLKTGMKDPDMGVWTYGYDPAGNLITQTDAKGQTVWFGYDGLNRLTEKRQNGAGGPVLAQYGYDSTADNVMGIGRRTSISNTQAQTRWAYDWRGRLQQEYITITGRTMPYGTAYQYDAADRVVRMGYPNGEWVTTTYDAGGQPYSLLGWNTVVVSATYTALGQPARTRFGNGLEARYWYFGLNTYPSWGNTAWGRLRRACVVTQTASGSCGDASPAPIFDLAYWYDLGGNIAYLDDVQNGGQRQYFAYDGLSRLVSAWTTAAGSGRYSETYVYNAIGNFVSKGGVTQGYADSVRSDTAHAHAVTHFNGDRRAWYDANGNMTQRVEVSGSQRITYTQEWDVENKLVAVTNTVAGQVTRFYRDADGNLVKKSDGAGTVMIVGSHFEHITATNESTSYYLFGGQRVAMRTSGAVYWLHGDHLGSASLTTNVSGQKVAELRYLPFGETRWAWGTTPTDRRYTGQREVPAIGLYDYNARMYWPAAGRFVSADTVVPDPHNPQQFNRYAYVVNNPLKHTDPTGHAPQRQDSDRCLRRNCQPYVEAGGNIVFDPRSGQYVNHGAPRYIPPSRQLPAPRSTSAPRLPAPKSASALQMPPVTPNRPDFYVRPDGGTYRSTGYRYINSNARYLDQLEATMTIPANSDPKGTYITPSRFASGPAARHGLQIAPEWSDASVRVEFDTLQLADLRVPYGRGGSSIRLEPITADYPEYGTGGHPQYVTNMAIRVDAIVRLPQPPMSIVPYTGPYLPMVKR